MLATTQIKIMGLFQALRFLLFQPLYLVTLSVRIYSAVYLLPKAVPLVPWQILMAVALQV